MSEQIVEVKELFRSCVEKLKRANETQSGTLDEILFRARRCQNAILENERKMWFRTPEGRDLLNQIATSVRGIDEIVTSLLSSSTVLRENFLALLTKELEHLEQDIARLKNELDKRQMVVT